MENTTSGLSQSNHY
jgi:hypothetical protein